MRNDLDRAIADFGMAIKLNPESELYLFNRGAALVDKHEPQRAIADFDAVLTHTPDNAKALYYRGVQKRVTGDAEGALNDIAEATRIDPDWVAAQTTH